MPESTWNTASYTGSLPTRPFLRDAGKNLIPGAMGDVDFLNQIGPMIQQIVMNIVHSMTQAGAAADANRIRTAGQSQARRAARGTADPNQAADVQFEGNNLANQAAQAAIAHAFSPEGALQIAGQVVPLASNPALTARLGAVGDINSNVSTSNVQKSPKQPGILGSLLGLGAQAYGMGAFPNIFAGGGGGQTSAASIGAPAIAGGLSGGNPDYSWLGNIHF